MRPLTDEERWLVQQLPPDVLPRLAQRVAELGHAKGSAHLELHIHVHHGRVQLARLDLDEVYQVDTARDNP